MPLGNAYRALIRAGGLGDQPALCNQWMADGNSPLFSGNPVTMANAELYCTQGPGYAPVRQPTVNVLPGESFGPGVATATAPNPITGFPSVPLTPRGPGVAASLYTPSAWDIASSDIAAVSPGAGALFDLLTGTNPDSGSIPSPPISNPLGLPSRVPTWVWIVAAMVGAVLVVELVK